MARWVWKNNRWLPCPDGAESHQTSGKYKAMLCLKTWILLSIVSFLRPLVQDSSAAAAEMVERPRKRQAVAHTKWCWTWTASNTVKFHKHRLKRLGFKMTSWLVASFFAVCFPSSGWCGGTFDYVANLATWLDEHFVPRLEAGFSESPKWQLPQSTMFVNRHLTSNAAEYFFFNFVNLYHGTWVWIHCFMAWTHHIFWREISKQLSGRMLAVMPPDPWSTNGRGQPPSMQDLSRRADVSAVIRCHWLWVFTRGVPVSSQLLRQCFTYQRLPQEMVWFDITLNWPQF